MNSEVFPGGTAGMAMQRQFRMTVRLVAGSATKDSGVQAGRRLIVEQLTSRFLTGVSAETTLIYIYRRGRGCLIP